MERSAREIFASLDIAAVDPGLVVAFDAQLAAADKIKEPPDQIQSQLALAGGAGQLIAIFLPGSIVGKGATDKQGLGLFYSAEPVPALSGTYRLEVLEKEDVLLHKGDKVVWSGKGVMEFNQLVGIYDVTF